MGNVIFDDLYYKLTINGGSKTRKETCSGCGGRGYTTWRDNDQGEIQEGCQDCGGSGSTLTYGKMTAGSGYEIVKYTTQPCVECGKYHQENFAPSGIMPFKGPRPSNDEIRKKHGICLGPGTKVNVCREKEKKGWFW